MEPVLHGLSLAFGLENMALVMLGVLIGVLQVLLITTLS